MLICSIALVVLGPVHHTPQVTDRIVESCCGTLCTALELDLQALTFAVGILKHKGDSPGAVDQFAAEEAQLAGGVQVAGEGQILVRNVILN